MSGGFQCVPFLFEKFEEWVETQPADRDPMHPDITGLSVVNIEMEAGDLLILIACSPTACALITRKTESAWPSIFRCIRPKRIMK